MVFPNTSSILFFSELTSIFFWTITSRTFFWTHIYFSPSSSLVLSFPSLFPHHLNHLKLADYVPPPQPSRRSTRPFSALSLADSSRPRRNRSPEAQVSFESLLKIVLGEIFLWVCAVISSLGLFVAVVNQSMVSFHRKISLSPLKNKILIISGSRPH